MGSYEVGVSIIRDTTYQDQLNLSETINVYDLSIELSQDIVLISNVGKDSIQYGGYLSVNALLADESQSPFTNDRPISVLFKDSLSHFKQFNGAEILTNDTLRMQGNYPSSFTIDSLAFYSKLDSSIRGPDSIALIIDSNQSKWYTQKTVRTTTLSVVPQDSMPTNFITGDIDFILPPFVITQDSVKALIPGYNLVFSTDNDTIDTTNLSSTFGDSIIIDPGSAFNEVIFNINDTVKNNINIDGLALLLANTTILRWHFIADSMLTSRNATVGLDTNEVITATPFFTLPGNDYNLDVNYRPAYFTGDTIIPRPYPQITIHDDGNTRCLANRTCTLKLPDGLYWNQVVPIAAQIGSAYIDIADNSSLIIDFNNYHSLDSLVLTGLTVIVNTSDTISSQLNISIINNAENWTSDHLFDIKIKNPPQLTLNSGDSSQVFWIDTSIVSLPEWHLATLLLSDTTQIYPERGLYFRSNDTTKFAFNDSVFSLPVGSFTDSSSIKSDSVETLTVKQVFESVGIQYCLTGNPDSLNAYWIDCNSIIFRAVDPVFNIPDDSKRVWLVDDENESITFNITTDYSVAFEEYSPIFFLPDSFPTSLFNDQKVILVDWIPEDTVSLVNYSFKDTINSVMNWASCGIYSPQIDLLDSSSSRSHAERYDSVKVGTFSAGNIGSIVSTVNDPLTILETIDIHLGWDTYNPQESAVQPLMKDDTIYIKLMDNGNLPSLNKDSISINPDSVEIKLDIDSISINENILLIPVSRDFADEDTFLQLAGLGIDSLTQDSDINMELKISLRPFAVDTTIQDHRQVTVADLAIGSPTITSASIIYSDSIPEHSLTLIEDNSWKTLHRAFGSVITDSNLDERVLALTILNQDTSIHWNTVRSFVPTSGQSSALWNDFNHRPAYDPGNDKTKYYSLINDLHDMSASATIYPFNDLIIGDYTEDNLIVGVGTNKNTYFDTLLYHLIDPPTAAFHSSSNTVFLATSEAFSISGFIINNNDETIESVKIIISNNLSCVWDTSAYSSFSFSSDGKVLSVGTTSRSVADTSGLSELRFKTTQPALSYSAPLRIIINGNRTVYSDQNITLGNPSSELSYPVTYLKEIDSDTVSLPPITIKQDMDLFAMKQERLLKESDNIFLSIPSSQIKFDTNIDSIGVFIYADSITHTKISIFNISDSLIYFDQIGVEFDSISIESISLIVDSQQWDNISINLSFGTNNSDNDMGHVNNPIRFGNLKFEADSDNISGIGPAIQLNLGSIDLIENDDVLFKPGQEFSISAFIDMPDTMIYLDWEDSPIEGHGYNVLSSDKNITLSLDTTSNLFIESLSPKININSLLALNSFSVDSFPRPVTIRVDLISNSDIVHFSDTLISFLIAEADTFHLPVFLSTPVASESGVTFNMIKGLVNTDSTDLIFNLAVAGDDLTSWSSFDAVIVDTNRQNLNSGHGGTKKQWVSQIREMPPEIRIRSSAKTVKSNNEKTKEPTSFISPYKPAVNLISENETNKQRTNSNQVTISLQWEDSTLFAFNEHLFEYISEQDDSVFTIQLNRNNIHSPDANLEDVSDTLNWDITNLYFSNGRNPLVDFDEDNGQIFNSGYAFTLDSATTDDSVEVQQITAPDNIGIDTTITLDSLQSFTTSSLGEGLYTIKIKPDGTFPIYRQIIKDITPPSVDTLSPQAVNNELTILNSDSADADSLTIKFSENFFVNDAGGNFIFQMDSQYLGTIDSLALITPMLNPPRNQFRFRVYGDVEKDTLYSDITLDTLSIRNKFISGFNQILSSDLEGSFDLVISILDAAENVSGLDTVSFNAMLTDGAEGDISDKIFNYPNPFSAGEITTFRYVLGKPVNKGQLAIFDAAGDIVYYWDLVADKKDSPGTQKIRWDGRNLFGDKLSTGVYFGYFEVNYSGSKKGEQTFLKIAILNQ